MDALITRARHPDAQLACLAAAASLVGWFLVASLAGSLLFASVPQASSYAAPHVPSSTVHVGDPLVGAPTSPLVSEPAAMDPGWVSDLWSRGDWIDRWRSTPLVDTVPVSRFSALSGAEVPVEAGPSLVGSLFRAGVSLGLVAGFALGPLFAFRWVWTTRSRRVRLTARQLEIGEDRFLLESEAEMARARRRLDELDLEDDLEEALVRLRRRLVHASLPPEADLRALAALRA